MKCFKNVSARFIKDIWYYLNYIILKNDNSKYNYKNGSVISYILFLTYILIKFAN